MNSKFELVNDEKECGIIVDNLLNEFVGPLSRIKCDVNKLHVKKWIYFTKPKMDCIFGDNIEIIKYSILVEIKDLPGIVLKLSRSNSNIVKKSTYSTKLKSGGDLYAEIKLNNSVIEYLTYGTDSSQMSTLMKDIDIENSDNLMKFHPIKLFIMIADRWYRDNAGDIKEKNRVAFSTKGVLSEVFGNFDMKSAKKDVKKITLPERNEEDLINLLDDDVLIINDNKTKPMLIFN